MGINITCLKETTVIKICIRPDGFHADDIMSCSILQDIFEDVNITRSSYREDLIDTDLHLGVGGLSRPSLGDFDYTSNDPRLPQYPDGKKMSTLGLIFNHFGDEAILTWRRGYIQEENWKEFNAFFKKKFLSRLVKPIDNWVHENKKTPSIVKEIKALESYFWEEGASKENYQFKKAMELSRLHIHSLIRQIINEWLIHTGR